MINSPYNTFHLVKALIAILVLAGSSTMITGIIQNNKGVMIGGVIGIIASAIMGMGFVISLRTRAKPIQNNTTISNPLLSSNV